MKITLPTPTVPQIERDIPDGFIPHPRSHIDNISLSYPDPYEYPDDITLPDQTEARTRALIKPGILQDVSQEDLDDFAIVLDEFERARNAIAADSREFARTIEKGYKADSQQPVSPMNEAGLDDHDENDELPPIRDVLQPQHAAILTAIGFAILAIERAPFFK